jgi:hypothetical protein
MHVFSINLMSSDERPINAQVTLKRESSQHPWRWNENGKSQIPGSSEVGEVLGTGLCVALFRLSQGMVGHFIKKISTYFLKRTLLIDNQYTKH